MATYSTIKGFNIHTLSADPKLSAEGAGTWSTKNDINVARRDMPSTGTVTAAIIAGGESNPTPGGYDLTESWNGSCWSEVNDLNTARKFWSGGAGTATSAVVAGGSTGPGAGTPTAVAETWDGSCWSTVNSINASRRAPTLFGTSSTNAVCAGGTPPDVGLVEEWNGTCWTEVNNLGSARYSMCRSGTSSDAIVSKGDAPSLPVALSVLSETYDGTSWAAAPDNNYGGYGVGSAGSGSTQGLNFGGSQPGAPPPGGQYSTTTESFNGTTWFVQADMAQPAANRSGCGTMTSALTSGGYNGGGNVSATEEWSVPSVVTVAEEGQVWYNSGAKVLKGLAKGYGTGAWASGTVVNTTRAELGGLGSTTAAIIAGGGPTPLYKVAESFDGSTWTTVNSTNSAKTYPGAGGTQTAGIMTGANSTNTETWDGTNWSETADMSTSRTQTYPSIAGTTTAMIMASGNPGDTTNAESWDGTSWTAIPAVNTGKHGGGGAGTQTSMITFGGYPPTSSNATESWNGSTWTEMTDMGTSRYHFGNSGTSNESAMCAGGTYPPGQRQQICEQWNGSAWTEVADISGAREAGAGNGTLESAGLFTGLGPGGALTDEVEIWTGPTTFSIKTFTAS